MTKEITNKFPMLIHRAKDLAIYGRIEGLPNRGELALEEFEGKVIVVNHKGESVAISYD